MNIQIICVAYERPIRLQTLINCFVLQTDPRWVLHIVYDGPAPQVILNIVEPFVNGNMKDKVHFYQSPERYEKYGHPNRKTMLQTIECDAHDFILMTNDDNYYVPRFVEFMLKEVTHNTGLVYCDTVHSHAGYDINYSELRENCIDMGAFMVRADVAKTTGFNHDHFSADGRYAEDCNRNCQKRNLRVVKIKKAIFIHN
jgi:hypothetical protein